MSENRPPIELLVQALEHLPAQDRQRVTAWVLGRVTRQNTPLAPRLPYASFSEEPITDVLFAGTSLKGDYQVVPVRLPAELHERLRDWCTEHGFAMATVIRGLLTRFLAGQDD